MTIHQEAKLTESALKSTLNWLDDRNFSKEVDDKILVAVREAYRLGMLTGTIRIMETNKLLRGKDIDECI